MQLLAPFGRPERFLLQRQHRIGTLGGAGDDSVDSGAEALIGDADAVGHPSYDPTDRAGRIRDGFKAIADLLERIFRVAEEALPVDVLQRSVQRFHAVFDDPGELVSDCRFYRSPRATSSWCRSSEAPFVSQRKDTLANVIDSERETLEGAAQIVIDRLRRLVGEPLRLLQAGVELGDRVGARLAEHLDQ